MIKDSFKTSIKELFTNRYLATLSIILVVLTLAFVIYIAVAVRPSELQLVTHYTAYGLTHLYRDQWWYLLSFGLLGLMMAFLHIAIAIKIFMVKGHPLAIMYAWLGIGIVVFAWVISSSIINVWSPL